MYVADIHLMIGCHVVNSVGDGNWRSAWSCSRRFSRSITYIRHGNTALHRRTSSSTFVDSQLRCLWLDSKSQAWLHIDLKWKFGKLLADTGIFLFRRGALSCKESISRHQRSRGWNLIVQFIIRRIANLFMVCLFTTLTWMFSTPGYLPAQILSTSLSAVWHVFVGEWHLFLRVISCFLCGGCSSLVFDHGYHCG